MTIAKTKVLWAGARIWFSPWRNRLVLPVLRSRLFAKTDIERIDPTWSEVLFQRLMGRLLRSPLLFLGSLRKTLRVCATYRCNLSCEACYARGLQEQFGTDMKLADFVRLVDWAKPKGWAKIRFLGGEPTMHPDFTGMLDTCYRNDMQVTLATNNFFSEEVLDRLDNPLVYDIAVNYSSMHTADEKQRRLFRDNLRRMSERSMPFSLSHIVDSEGKDPLIPGLFEDIRRYRPTYLRVSLELPAPSDPFTTENLFRAREVLFRKIYGILKRCAKLYTPFYVYRPVPLCLFSTKQRAMLKRFSSFVFFSRCPLSYAGDGGYGTMVTINPDMSTFPCASVFLKGPEISSMGRRQQRHDFYRQILEPHLKKTLMDECEKCKYHEAFLKILAGNKALQPMLFHRPESCQGGCINLRCHEFQKSGCAVE
ncbi:radical SAM protein [Elusimicrobiota bacterium]